MFSGLIQHTGRVISNISKNSEGYIEIENEKVASQTQIGGSVAVNGACLTIIEKNEKILKFFVSYETFIKSNLPYLKYKDIVNLELPCTLNTFLDGHLVLGHIDTLGEIKKIEEIQETINILIRIQDIKYMKYIVSKGSITVNGISLTIADVLDNSQTFGVSIIPSTFNHTNLRTLKTGDKVNLEFDIIAKYIERFLSFQNNMEKITYSKLKDFIET